MSTFQHSLQTSSVDAFLIKPDSTVSCCSLCLYLQTPISFAWFAHTHHAHSRESHMQITHILFPAEYLCFGFKAELPNISRENHFQICQPQGSQWHCSGCKEGRRKLSLLSKVFQILPFSFSTTCTRTG